MAAAMRLRWHFGSPATVNRMAHKLGFRHVQIRLRPELNAVAMEKRLAWANALLEDGEQPYSEADVVYIHVDEKWFFTTLRNRRFWVAPGEKTPSIAVASKSHITKVMFLGAVARPVQAHGFDGRIGLYPCRTLTIASFNCAHTSNILFTSTEHHTRTTRHLSPFYAQLPSTQQFITSIVV